MKRAIITALCLFTCLSLGAQVTPNQVISFPSRYHKYYDSLSTSLYEKFFAEWEGWSELVAKGTASNKYNEIFAKHFCESNQQAKEGSKHLTLPLYVKVIRYDCDINLDSDRIPDPYSLKKSMMPESITYFTPVIESDKKVLYVSPEVETILAGYIEEGRKSSPEEFQKRENTIGELIPTTIAHWGDGWFFLSYPNIHEIVITNNGYYIDLADADYSGQMLFVPWNKDPIEVYFWIQ